MHNNNVGEASNYTFTYKSPSGYTVGESIVITFPWDFDPFIGKASVWMNQEPGVYYMDCSSTTMGLTWCTVDKWTVTVMGSAAVAADTAIDITLKYVMNPHSIGSGQKIIFSTVGTDGVYKSMDYDF